MSSSSPPPRPHAGPRRGTDPEGPPEPSHAERARTLLSLEHSGSLATQSRKHPGWPFASVMPYALDADGSPLFLISAMAVHTQNLEAEARCSLLVQQSGSGDPLAVARVTLMGMGERLGDQPEARQCYLERHPKAQYWVDFADFRFYRMRVEDLYYVGGFGVMGWVEAEAFRAAAPDPLAPAAAGILAHMNDDHGDAMRLLARAETGVEPTDARMTAVDRLGFHLRLEVDGQMRGLRIPFPQAVRHPSEVRQVLVEMVRRARAKSS